VLQKIAKVEKSFFLRLTENFNLEKFGIDFLVIVVVRTDMQQYV